jgi:hypothetical protein
MSKRLKVRALKDGYHVCRRKAGDVFDWMSPTDLPFWVEEVAPEVEAPEPAAKKVATVQKEPEVQPEEQEAPPAEDSPPAAAVAKPRARRSRGRKTTG